MDRQMNGWIDTVSGWKDKWIDIDGRYYGWMERQMDKQMDRYTVDE